MTFLPTSSKMQGTECSLHPWQGLVPEHLIFFLLHLWQLWQRSAHEHLCSPGRKRRTRWIFWLDYGEKARLSFRLFQNQLNGKKTKRKCAPAGGLRSQVVGTVEHLNQLKFWIRVRLGIRRLATKVRVSLKCERLRYRGM